MKHVLAGLVVSAALTGCQSAAPAGGVASASHRACASDSAKPEIAATIRALFAALAKDDDDAVRRLTTPGFYAFDLGKRFTGPELSKLVADAHRAGRTIEWNIGPVDARIDCNLAFAAWENQGAAGVAPNLAPRAWLESALLIRQGDRWIIDFLHSTPKDPRP